MKIKKQYQTVREVIDKILCDVCKKDFKDIPDKRFLKEIVLKVETIHADEWETYGNCSETWDICHICFEKEIRPILNNIASKPTIEGDEHLLKE